MPQGALPGLVKSPGLAAASRLHSLCQVTEFGVGQRGHPGGRRSSKLTLKRSSPFGAHAPASCRVARTDAPPS